jgi:hypothetical protein
VIERLSYRRAPIKKAGILLNSLRLCKQDFLYGSLMPGLSRSRWTGRRMRPHRRPPLRAPWNRIEAPPPRLISAEHHRRPPAMLGRPSHGAPRADLVACRRGRVGRRNHASLRRLRLERQSSGRTAPCYPEVLLPPRRWTMWLTWTILQIRSTIAGIGMHLSDYWLCPSRNNPVYCLFEVIRQSVTRLPEYMYC